MNTATRILIRPALHPTRGFTLVECLVVVVALLAFAAIAFAVLIRGAAQRKVTRCLTNLRQVGLAYQRYLKDYDFWMPCGGNADGEHYSDQDPVGPPPADYEPELHTFGAVYYSKGPGPPTYELPWFRPAFARNRDFPYWYEALLPFIDPSATAAAARDSYKARTSEDIDFGPGRPQPATRVEQARLARVFACPAKPDAPVGDGYNYTAPFGNTYCYPNRRDKFRWYRNASDAQSGINGSPWPMHYNGVKCPIPILWYEQYIHSSTLTKQSIQVLVCETGRSTPETRDLTDSRLWRETEDNNDEGYVRFPLMQGYWLPNHRVPVYRLKPWRPMPRHGGKAACLSPDGNARMVPIRELCNPAIQWGDPGCLFDNRPPTKPPITPLRTYDGPGKSESP